MRGPRREFVRLASQHAGDGARVRGRARTRRQEHPRPAAARRGAWIDDRHSRRGRRRGTRRRRPWRRWSPRGSGSRDVLMLTGVAVAPGEAIGPAVVVRLRAHDVRYRIANEDVASEQARLRRGVRPHARAAGGDSRSHAARPRRRTGGDVRRAVADARRPAPARAGRCPHPHPPRQRGVGRRRGRRGADAAASRASRIPTCRSDTAT